MRRERARGCKCTHIVAKNRTSLRVCVFGSCVSTLRAESCEESWKRRRSILFFPEKVMRRFFRSNAQKSLINIQIQRDAAVLSLSLSLFYINSVHLSLSLSLSLSLTVVSRGWLCSQHGHLFAFVFIFIFFLARAARGDCDFAIRVPIQS